MGFRNQSPTGINVWFVYLCVSLITPREGVNQVAVLGAIIRRDEPPRQQDIVADTALSKGAVSQNIAKLEDARLVREDDGRYAVDEERLLDLYRDHLDDYLRQRELPEELSSINDVRRAVATQLDDILSGSTGSILTDILRQVLRATRTDSQVNTLRDVFHRTDTVVSRLAEATDSDEYHDLRMLAVCMDRASDLAADMDADHDMTRTVTARMAGELMEEIDE